MSGKNTILVVDDSTTNLLGLQKILERENYNVLTTVRGDQALQMLRDKSVDVVLLDLMMPGFSGYDVLGEIQKDNSLREIPVIIVSARSDSKDVKQTLDKGAVDYIKKPIDIVELLARIGAAIRLKNKQTTINTIKTLFEKANQYSLEKLVSEIRKSNKKLDSLSNADVKNQIALSAKLCDFVDDFLKAKFE